MEAGAAHRRVRVAEHREDTTLEALAHRQHLLYLILFLFVVLIALHVAVVDLSVLGLLKVDNIQLKTEPESTKFSRESARNDGFHHTFSRSFCAMRSQRARWN